MKSTAAIFLERDRPLEIDEIDIGEPGPREVALELVASGVCGTQLHMMARTTAVPTLLGHEASGRVVAVGSEVSHVREGDTVLLSSMPSLAPDDAGVTKHPWTWRGSSHTNMDEVSVFAWASHTIADERSLTRVPEDLPLEAASVLGCAGITGSGAVLNDGKVGAGDDVVIWGAGGVGLFGVMAAAAVGARHIIAVDLNARALELATKLGATLCLDPRRDDVVATVREVTGGGATAAVDTVGSCAADALRAVRHAAPGQRRGGTAVLVQISPGEKTLNLRELFVLGKTATMSIAGGGRPQVDIPRYLDWFRAGRYPFEDLVTRRFRLTEINEACEALRTGETIGRSVITFS